jgi:carboxypeptidase PM20D1
MLRILLLIVLALAGVGGYAAWRTVHYLEPKPQQTVAVAPGAAIDYDMKGATERLAVALQFKTVANLDGLPADPAAFESFIQWIGATYPALSTVAPAERIATQSLLFTWPGSDPAAQPILLIANSDVPPVDPVDLPKWSVDPFSGALKNNAKGRPAIWGRGAIKGKGPLIAMLEAANALAASGFKPRRTIYIAVGQDGMVRGEQGAKAIAAVLAERKVKAWFALSEGFGILTEAPLTGKPAALIGVSEKQEALLRLASTSGEGATIGPSGQATTELMRATVAVTSMAMSPTLNDPVTHELFTTLVPQMPRSMQAALANTWLSGPFVMRRLAERPGAAAMLMSTVSPTLARGGEAGEVFPANAASAILTVRLYPADTAGDFLSRVRNQLRDSPGVTAEWITDPGPALAPSRWTTDGYLLVAALARHVSSGAIVAPALFPLPTDSRHYSAVATDTYRFTPGFWSQADIASLLGVDGNLSVEELQRMIGFYAQVMSEAAGGS